MNEKVKIRNIKTGAIKIVNKSIAGDFIGTKNFEIVKDEQNRRESFTSKDRERNK